MTPRVLLFDVDATLVITGGAGLRAMARALAHVPGAPEAMLRRPLGGMTDRIIVREAVESCGVACTPGEIDAVLARYVGFLAEEVPVAPEYRVMPGVMELVPRLAARAELALGLGTGNVEQGARIKLARAGLDRYFAFGGYGSDADERPDVLRTALRRASTHLGRAVAPEECLVIGDTPRDAEAARAVGIRCVGVATGRHTREQLAAAGADRVLADLTEFEGVFAELG